MAKRHCSLIISLLFLNPISCLNAGEDVVYSIHRFDKAGRKTISQGHITDEQCQLFLDTVSRCASARELPKDANIFGLLTIIKNKDLIAMPVYSWKEKKNWLAKSAVYCGYQFEDGSGTMLTSHGIKCDEQQYLEDIENGLTAQFNFSCDVRWDPNSIRTVAVYGSKNELKLSGFILQLDKTEYRIGEPIDCKIRVVNRSDKYITFANILPFRSSSNPPSIRILNLDTKEAVSTPFSTDGIPAPLVNENPTVIAPGNELIVFDADLNAISGHIHSELTPNGYGKSEECEHLGTWLQAGRYKITGLCDMAVMDGIEFTIKDRE
jgi:hypothetical protein